VMALHAGAAADAEADAGGWRVLRPQSLDQCGADSDGDHLYVVDRPADAWGPARWRCHWCGSPSASPLWCSALEPAS
jgi:hypothetical protein